MTTWRRWLATYLAEHPGDYDQASDPTGYAVRAWARWLVLLAVVALVLLVLGLLA